MDIVLVGLRLLHIGAGIYWAGSIAFLTLVLEPRYRAQGTQNLRRVMRPLMPVMGPSLLAASLTTILAGAALILWTHGSDLDFYIETDWGRTILLGAVAAIAALIVGDGLVRIERRRLDNLGAALAQRTLEGDPPGPDDQARIERLEARLWLLGRMNFVLVVIAVAAMATARYF